MIYGQVAFHRHMRVCITLATMQTTLWIIWVLFISRQKHRYLCLVCQIWFILAAALEVWDFPPYERIFDAHCLWHAATMPLGYVWYLFWALDAKAATAAIETVNTTTSSSVASSRADRKPSVKLD